MMLGDDPDDFFAWTENPKVWLGIILTVCGSLITLILFHEIFG